MKNRSCRKALVIALCLLAVAVLSVFGFRLVEDKLGEEGTETYTGLDQGGDASAEIIYYQGERYKPNKNVETVLVLGIDRFSDGTGVREDYQQSDFLALLVMNHEAESFQLLHLNRDTMTDIPLKDITGVQYGTRYAQLTLAHTYGQSEASRCRNSVAAVENLLYGVSVDHFVSLTMDAVALLNDAVGGVTVQIMEDMTTVDPAFCEGATVTLSGDQALNFVRARGALSDSSNLSRMERQRQYIGALFEKFTTSKIQSKEVLFRLGERMTSDLTLDQLSTLEEKLVKYSYSGIGALQGEAVQGEEYMEFYVDEASLKETVVALFYTHMD